MKEDNCLVDKKEIIDHFVYRVKENISKINKKLESTIIILEYPRSEDLINVVDEISKSKEVEELKKNIDILTRKINKHKKIK